MEVWGNHRAESTTDSAERKARWSAQVLLRGGQVFCSGVSSIGEGHRVWALPAPRENNQKTSFRYGEVVGWKIWMSGQQPWLEGLGRQRAFGLRSLPWRHMVTPTPRGLRFPSMFSRIKNFIDGS